MKTSSSFVVVIVLCIYAVTDGGDLRRKKQVGTGVSFAFPGLNLFGGGNNNGGNIGNVFAQGTFTRTIVSTVSTVTTASFRTCTVSIGALAMTPCVGRRKREADIRMASYNYDNEIFMDHDEANNLGMIDPSASIALIVGSTTLTDPLAVSEYLLAHQPSSQSIIYPQDVTIAEIENLQNQPTIDNTVIKTEMLYPSNDSPDSPDSSLDDQNQDITTTIHYNDDIDDLVLADPTTEIPLNDDAEGQEITTPHLILEDGNDVEQARLGFSQTTVTTIIRVTSVATTLASGSMATLSVMYAGCLPPSLPVSGVPTC
jgi:hypothetical protein